MKPTEPALVEAKNFFKEHPAILGSILYIQVLCLGFTYYWALFNAFRINIFDFSAANDFLLAAFKDPQVFVLAMVSIALLALQTWIFKTRGIALRNFPSVTIFLVLAILYTIGTPVLLARRNAREIKSGLRSRIGITVKDDECTGGAGQASERKVMLIGTTEKYAFLFDRVTRIASAVPVESITSIRFESLGSEGLSPERKVERGLSKDGGRRKKGA